RGGKGHGREGTFASLGCGASGERLEMGKQLGLGDAVDLRGAVFGQKGTKAEMGGVEVRVMLADELFELPSALRGAKNRLRRATEKVAGLMGEGVREGLPGKGREVEVPEYVLEVPIGAAGPLRTTNDQWGGASALLGTPPLHHLVQQGYHLGDIRWSLNNEVKGASGGVYRVGPVDLAHALVRMDGLGGMGSQWLFRKIWRP
ncbi:MAG: hypothetical protein FD189_2594, partial [Elusimicrobia bacterium]